VFRLLLARTPRQAYLTALSCADHQAQAQARAHVGQDRHACALLEARAEVRARLALGVSSLVAADLRVHQQAQASAEVSTGIELGEALALPLTRAQQTSVAKLLLACRQPVLVAWALRGWGRRALLEDLAKKLAASAAFLTGDGRGQGQGRGLADGRADWGDYRLAAPALSEPLDWAAALQPRATGPLGGEGERRAAEAEAVRRLLESEEEGKVPPK
jgi:hypothetical protein